MLNSADLLVVLVAFTGQKNDVVLATVLDDMINGFAPVFNDNILALFFPDSDEYVVDDIGGLLKSGIIGCYDRKIGET